MILDKKEISSFYTRYTSDKNNKVVENAMTKNGIKNSSINNEVFRFHNHEFSVQVPKAGMTNQKNSGRCWIFSSTNMLKTNVLKSLNVDSFQFSENYLFFWDKMEKSNTFLELMISNPELNYLDRLFCSFMDMTVSDGGYWEWAQGLIKKYGLAPKSVMDDTFNSTSSGALNEVLNFHLIDAANRIRVAHKVGKNLDDLRKIKHDALAIVFEVCAKALGLPPVSFDFEYRDKDKKFHRITNITPLEFLNKYVGMEFLNKVNLLHDPRDIYPKNRLYVSKYYKSVIEEKAVNSINTTVDEIKKAIIASLKDGTPVWFDCDVSLFSERKEGVFDTELFNYQDSLHIYNTLTKKDRVNYRMSNPNHAMTFVGVDLDENDQPIKWEVENSWGDENGKKGYFSMSDKWFDEYCFGAIVDPKYVSNDVLSALEEPAIELEPWDPMA
ncbi:C1 family peptidase [Mycoplasmopsis felifaucium]|uniref:Aminopeptidase n=1 Tax=Mycoplasmopsis felifaucium TaxID=35768 RepID=A0ABZ2RPK2_9BACT